MRRAALLAALVLAVITSSADARFPWTHRIAISGQFVDHWTVTDPSHCGTNGDGTVTVTFKNKSSIHAVVTRYNYGDHTWLLIGLTRTSFHQTTFLPPQPASGSITTVDNTAPANPYPGDTCEPIDKSHCGTKDLRRPTLRLQGLDGSRLKFDLVSDSFRSTGCQVGTPTGFGDVDFFGHKTPELAVKMPSPRSFFRRRVVKVTGASHDQRSSPDLDATVTDDVTRTVTVTFTRR
jgi:hypothetical protein